MKNIRIKQETKSVLLLVFVLLFAAATIHSMLWTFNAFDPVRPEYRNLELQFGLQLMHMLLFFWMLFATILAFGKFYKGRGNPR